MENNTIPWAASNATEKFSIYWLGRNTGSKYYFVYFMLHNKRSDFRSPQSESNPLLHSVIQYLRRNILRQQYSSFEKSVKKQRELEHTEKVLWFRAIPWENLKVRHFLKLSHRRQDTIYIYIYALIIVFIISMWVLACTASRKQIIGFFNSALLLFWMHSSYSIAPSGWQFACTSFLLSWKLSVNVLRKEMRDTAAQRVAWLIENPKLEGTHKDNWVQLLAPHRTTQKLDHITKSIFQTLLELQQTLSCKHYPGESVPVPSHVLSEEPFCFIQPEPLSQFHAILLGSITDHQREEDSVAPPYSLVKKS